MKLTKKEQGLFMIYQVMKLKKEERIAAVKKALDVGVAMTHAGQSNPKASSTTGGQTKASSKTPSGTANKVKSSLSPGGIIRGRSSHSVSAYTQKSKSFTSISNA